MVSISNQTRQREISQAKRFLASEVAERSCFTTELPIHANILEELDAALAPKPSELTSIILSRAKELEVRPFSPVDWTERTKGRDVAGAIILAANEHQPTGYDRQAHWHTRFPRVTELKNVLMELNPLLSEEDSLLASRIMIRSNDSALPQLAWKVAALVLDLESATTAQVILTKLAAIFPPTLRESPHAVHDRSEAVIDHLNIVSGGSTRDRLPYRGSLDENEFPSNWELIRPRAAKIVGE